jgi:hypothetical protein
MRHSALKALAPRRPQQTNTTHTMRRTALLPGKLSSNQITEIATNPENNNDTPRFTAAVSL